MKVKSCKKVFVAMSGGVDSTVAALLLKKQGYQVIGVHFLLAKSQTLEVKRICQKLKIKLYIWDFRPQFSKSVIKDFITQYKDGVTPNPCVICNRMIKFGLFYERAKKAGADYIATGHYVQKAKVGSCYLLKKGKDYDKDQSYFLWDLKPLVISHCLFPLGKLTKDKVKRIAAKYRLPRVKNESQEICFITDKICNYLSNNIKSRPGIIRDFTSKKKVGRHQGLFLYTIGQRSGLRLAGGPWFVLKKDISKNILWVTKDSKSLFSLKAELKKVNWLITPPEFPVTSEVKPRYRHPGVQAIIKKTGNGCCVSFKKPERALTPGQSAVFYKGDELLGGGIIK
ncbi:MAG: tRNA 2-thiouridine(34) synthase MnmA [Patescibacteria group bacterium]